MESLKSEKKEGVLVNKKQNQCMFIEREASERGDQEIWYGPLSNGESVLLLFNQMSKDVTMTIDVEFARKYIPILFSNSRMGWKAKELWSSDKTEVNFDDKTPLIWTVKAHGVAVFKLTSENI